MIKQFSIWSICNQSKTSSTRERLPFLRKAGEKFPSNGTGIFLAPKTGTGLSCTIYTILVNFSLSLDFKPGTGNQKNWYRKFRSFR